MTRIHDRSSLWPQPMILLLLAAITACSVDTTLDPTLPVRCGPGGECLPGFVCSAAGLCRQTASAQDDAYATDEDTPLSVLAAQGVLGNDRVVVGVSPRVELITPPEHGAVQLEMDGALTYTPAIDYAGADAFTYRITVGAFASNSATVRLTVRPKPDAPRAASDQYTTDEDTPLVVGADAGVLRNDLDPDGDSLTAIVDTAPEHGTLTLATTGAFTYTPARDFAGTDTFRYRASDGDLQSMPWVVSITVVPRNDAPTARDDRFRTVPGGVLEVPFWLGLGLNDSDVEDSPLTVALVTGPPLGDLSLRADGSFTYAAPPAFVGDVRFTYRVNDGELTSAAATVTISVEPPPALPIYLASIGSAGIGLASSGDSIAISANGNVVAFSSQASNFLPDGSSTPQVYVNDRQGIRRVSSSPGGAEGNAQSGGPSLSADGRLVAFDSTATNLVTGASNGERHVFVRDRGTGTTTRISVNNAGVQGDRGSARPAISADGRFVAFSSSARNLVDTAPLGESDIFVHDLQTHTTSRVSLRTGGAAVSISAIAASISADGRFVAFTAEGPGLVDGDTNGSQDVFVHDRQTVTTVRVGVSSAGVQGDRGSSAPSISADGSIVAFASPSTNLVPGDTGNFADVFVHDLRTHITRRVSVSATGEAANNASTLSAGGLSGDGLQVAFSSTATNLVPGDTNGDSDIFVADLRTGAIRRVSVGPTGAQLDLPSANPAVLSHDGSYVAFRTRAQIDPRDTTFRDDVYVAPNPPPRLVDLVTLASDRRPADGPSATRASVSFDGRFVAFESAATNLVEADQNGVRDVFVRDLAVGVTERVSVSTQGAAGNGVSVAPSISPDGRWVAFSSAAQNLVTADQNGVSDVFLRDRERGTTARVSVGVGGVEANGSSDGAALCGFAACVVFASRATNLVAGTSTARQRIYLRDLRANTTLLISQGMGGADPNGDSSTPTVSGDGRYVAFVSSATNLIADDTNGWPDVFVFDRTDRTTTRVSVGASGRPADVPCEGAAISGDGRYVTFHTRSSMQLNDGGGRLKVFLHDRQTHTTTRVSNSMTGGPGNLDSSDGWLSNDGRFAVFSSAATDLVADDRNTVADVFVLDRTTGVTSRVSQSIYGEGDAASSLPVISGDGRTLVFQSNATNLVPGDTNGQSDLVFARNPGLFATQ